MSANFINFVDALIYGDSGAAELTLPVITNHLNWTLANAPTSALGGTAFLTHHLDEMLARYDQWRGKYGLPPTRPWDGSNVFPAPGAPPSGPTPPATLAGGPFPGGWTAADLGVAVRDYYNSTVRPQAGELSIDEVKAPYSYRYWAFMKWASDLRKRLLGQRVLPVAILYDRDGTILSDKDWLDSFNQAHHVWHPGGNAGAEPSWTVPTPFLKSSAGQFRGKKKITRAQIGEEFFAFHRDHLEIYDRWLARTGQDPVQSLNTCGHDSSTPTSPAPAGVDAGESGLPKIDFSTTPPTVNFAVALASHTSIWEGTRPGFDGTLREFSSTGEMGQFMATDFQVPSLFTPPAIVGTGAVADSGYHGEGHVLNGDLYSPEHNNYVHRFFAWHGFLDDRWALREPGFVTFEPVLADGVTTFPSPLVMTILREFSTSSDSVEPANSAQGLDLANGFGTFRCRFRVKTDPFGRPLRLTLRCQVLREATGPAPVIELPLRVLTIAPVQQNTDIVESFVFDGSAGTVDAGGQGPFASNNLLFASPGTGFRNSLFRIVATLTSERHPDNTTPAAPGTVTSVGTAVTGTGTTFQTTFRNGDIIRAGDQTRVVWLVNSNTSLTLSMPFTPDVAAATAYVWVEGFEHEQRIEIPLVQESDTPDVTVYLDHSSFSKDEVDATPGGVFDNAFYVLLQDRTSRPAPIVWPSDPKTDVILPQFKGLIAPPVRAAGLYADLAHAPTVELLELSNTPVTDVTVEALNPQPEDPTLHPSIPQRITYTCRVSFASNSAFSGMVAGDTRLLKLRITARDRSGNTLVDDSTRVRLQVNANPYMNDGPISWLSVDTRVFQIPQGQAKFGVPAGWTNPNTFIKQAIKNLRLGGGTSGGDSFDGLTQDETQAVLEYSPQVGGVNIYNFALSKVRLRSLTGAAGVRCIFRLFRWGTANVSFDNTLAYRSSPTGIGMLGRTTINELASIPFYAEPRVALTADMSVTQQDGAVATNDGNVFDFGPTGGAESASFFGAYLDVNQSSELRFPDTFVNDGPFNAVTAKSIRDLLIGQHQCMICEIMYTPDPTAPGATPGDSDNLAQRNLLIVQTANPGSLSTRQVQHSFDIDLTRKRRLPPKPQAEPHGDVFHVHARGGQGEFPEPVPALARPEPVAGGHGGHASLETRLAHITDSWLQQAPELLKRTVNFAQFAHDNDARWQFHESDWRRLDGLDELAFFWNNLPLKSQVEVFLPGCDVTEIVNYRNLRHAPGTVQVSGPETLRLTVGGPVYLPVPAVFGDNIAGLMTVTLPPGIKHGQKFRIDVLQLRSDEERVLGGFQLNIPVNEARVLIDPETRLLQTFQRRVALTPKASRWHGVLERQRDYLRERARGFADLAGVPWTDPTIHENGEPVRVILDRIEITDSREPFGLKGEFYFHARVFTKNNGGILREQRMPAAKFFGAKAGTAIPVGAILFEGYAEDHLAIEITGAEHDVISDDDKLCPYKRVFTGSPSRWIGVYGPTDEEIDPEQLEGWRVFYRIDRG